MFKCEYTQPGKLDINSNCHEMIISLIVTLSQSMTAYL